MPNNLNFAFDIQQRSLKVKDAHFLEASAGTGKTYTIEHLVVRLLLETSLSIEQILVVTFTRAATRELKRRIRTILLRTKEALYNRSSNIDYLIAIYEHSEESIKDALKKIDAALICFDGAQIFTLHGFCYRMLNEFAFESKVGQELTSPDHTRPSFHYKRAVEDFLLNHLSSSDYSARQLHLLLKKMHNDPLRLIHKIVRLLSQETPILSYPSLPQLHEQLNEALKNYPVIVPELFISDFERLSACYKGIKINDYQKQRDALIHILKDGVCSRDFLETLISDEEWFLEKMQKEHLKSRSVLPREDTLHYPALFDALRKELLPLIKALSSPIKMALRLAKDCQVYANQFLIHQECFSPDQILRRFEAALDDPVFLYAIRGKYQAVIIDEFQDTDQIQWKMFQRLFLNHLETLCLVGDPKQSIYAFRNADIYTYLDAAAALGKDKHKYLDTNFRSTLPLIEALNCLFAAPKGEGWLILPKMKRAMPVYPVKAGSKDLPMHSLVSKGAVHFFIAIGDKERARQWPTREIEENQLFSFLAAEISDLKKKRNIVWEEIAILVKDRFQADRLQTYLKKCAIPSSFRRGKSLAHSAVLNAFSECLQAIFMPSNSSYLKIALGGLLIGWDEKLLRGDLHSPCFQEAKMQMQLLQNILFQKGFGPFFSAFLTAKWPPNGSCIGQNILERGDSALYQDLRKLSEILIEEEVARKLQGEDFLHYLGEIEKEAEEQENRFEIPLREAKGSVALMTIYLSKGLEFDTVFALALASRHVTTEEETIKLGAQHTLMAFDENNSACIEALEEIDAEKMRALYVALTRAKQQLYIPCIIDRNAKILVIGDASPIELFLAKIAKQCNDSTELYEEIARLNQESIESMLYGLSACCSLTYSYINNENIPSQCNREIQDPLLLAPPCFDFILKPEFLLSFSSLTPRHAEKEQLLISTPIDLWTGKETENVLPLGSETGVVVHRIFEIIFKCGLHHPLHEKKIKDLIAYEVEYTALSNWKKDLTIMVIDQLNLCLLQKDRPLRIRDIPCSQLSQELEFLFPLAGKGMMKGFADLIFFYEDKYYLLDWKTNYLGPTEQDYTYEKMEHAMKAHHYFLQASIYTAALERYVKLFDTRPFQDIFGGAFYLFVRGNAFFHFVPSSNMEV